MTTDEQATGAPPTDGEGTDESFDALVAFIAESRAIDFSGYKRTSLTRRIAKRMGEVGTTTYDEYRDLLETSSEEFRSLFDTVLINVTSFFRDAPAWEHLRAEVLPDLVQDAGNDEIRVWSAGCSSGEEPYSLAITFAEAMGIDDFLARVKIYATDIDEGALGIARQGTYHAKSLEPMSPELIDRYFEVSGSRYSLRPDLRRRVIFGRHDVTHDAPISHIHLLACRNTLMYFNADTQAQVIDRFHFGLRESGLLFLGKAEMLLSEGQRFEVQSTPHRIFRRRPGSHPYRSTTTQVSLDAPATASGALRHRQLRELALDVSPIAHVVIDVNGTVLVANNRSRAMFGLTARDEGRPLRDLEISYRPVELRSLIEQAQTERRIVRLTAVERRLGGHDLQYVDVQVQPLVSDDGVVLGADVTFTDTTAFVRLQEEAKRTSQELETAYEELQSTNEELETTNEELQSSIEELETTNEELQSTNEELETTNEELQSSNEELETMNEELRARTGELDELTAYLESILASVPEGIVVLDAGLRVRSWNHQAEELWGLRSDEALTVAFFALDFGLPTGALREAVRTVLEDGTTRRVELEAVNRLGRPITCAVTIGALGTRGEGVVLSMEERERG